MRGARDENGRIEIGLAGAGSVPRRRRSTMRPRAIIGRIEAAGLGLEGAVTAERDSLLVRSHAIVAVLGRATVARPVGRILASCTCVAGKPPQRHLP